MCLITKKEMNRVLTEPMTVWKLLKYDPTRPSPCYHTAGPSYELGKPRRTEIVDISDGSEVRHQPAYDRRATDLKLKLANEVAPTELVVIGPGFHSAESIERLIEPDHKTLMAFYQASMTLGIFRCTVPAGATVYWDGDGLLVSSEIVIDELEREHNIPGKLAYPEWLHLHYDTVTDRNYVFEREPDELGEHAVCNRHQAWERYVKYLDEAANQL